MTALARAFDRLTTVERSFHVDAPWRGAFELDGHDVRCALDSGEWVRLSSRLAGDERDLIRRQCGVLLPIKIVAGPALIAEMPLTEDLASTFDVLRSVLRQGFALSASVEQEDLVMGQDDAARAERLESVLQESAFTWEHDKEHLLTKAGTARIVCRAIGTSVVFQTTVIHIGPPTGSSFEALTHFVLAANARFRFVRSTPAASRLVQEVALPSDLLTPTLVNRAVEAIGASVRTTKKACAALADGRVAEQYMEFHKQGDKSHADTHH